MARSSAQRLSVAEELDSLRCSAGLLAELTLVAPLSDEPRDWLQRIARLLVPRLADGCLFEVAEGPRLQALAAAHKVPATAEALLNGDAEALRNAFLGPALRVPLAVRGDALGYLTVWSERDRSFGPGEHALVECMARHVAAQIDNARLFARTQADARLREEFISLAAHELRTPLQSLGLGLQLIEARLESTADELPRAWLEGRIARTRQQVSRLKRLVDSLLNVSELQSGSLELSPEPLDLADLAREVLASADDDLRWAGCAATLDVEPASGRWDRLRLELIASNLIVNAMKYGAGKPVTVRVQAGDQRASLSVSDQGIGIAPADQQRIFERFERLDRGPRVSGFGLGLWIVRELASAMGGSVRVQSAPGQGSTFTVELPR